MNKQAKRSSKRSNWLFTMKKISVLVLEFAATAGLLLGAGCAQHRTVYVREPAPAPPRASGETVIRVPPPAPQVEVVGAAPGPQYVWMPGCWEWRGNWLWAGGRFAVAPHPDAHWIPGHWVWHQRSYVWIRGYWR
jgi:hypothetical protein